MLKDGGSFVLRFFRTLPQLRTPALVACELEILEHPKWTEARYTNKCVCIDRCIHTRTYTHFISTLSWP